MMTFKNKVAPKNPSQPRPAFTAVRLDRQKENCDCGSSSHAAQCVTCKRSSAVDHPTPDRDAAIVTTERFQNFSRIRTDTNMHAAMVRTDGYRLDDVTDDPRKKLTPSRERNLLAPIPPDSPLLKPQPRLLFLPPALPGQLPAKGGFLEKEQQSILLTSGQPRQPEINLHLPATDLSKQSVSGRITDKIDEMIHPLIRGLPARWQKMILNASHSAVEKGEKTILDEALKTTPLGTTGREAVLKAIEGLLMIKF